ncbi:hypothetical protein [Streptomyces coelicoflavus]|uniref:hypothetical protein n=1 Tax=Streptomyces coelicoflavus TaxID=285562 RepID=UPI0036CD4DFA
MRAVNLWDFADQRLPQGGGEAVWSCARAITWRGSSEVSVRLRTDGTDPARVVARSGDTAACSRFGQHVVAGARWLSPKGDWYRLAAGSRAVTSLAVTGGVTARSDGRTLAVRASKDAQAEVTGHLATGDDVSTVPTADDPHQ